MTNNENFKKLSEEEMKKILEEKDKNLMNSGSNTDDAIIDDPYLKNAQKIKELTGKQGLGNVKLFKEDSNETSDMLLGWHNLDPKNLPSGGLFYPEDTKILIRAARVSEIRHWSTLNEEDLFDIEDKLNYIMKECVKVKSSVKPMIWKDILEEDRIYVILAIRDLTFKHGENKLQVSKACPECNHMNTIEIKNQNWEYNKIPDELFKYYDDQQRALVIPTKSYGTIKIKPPSIGIMNIVSNYIKTKRSKNESWDQAYIQLFPYLRDEWRGVTDKDVFNGEVDFKGWDDKKYILYYRLAEKIKVGVKPYLVSKCIACGAEVTAQVDFRESGGLKKIFVPDISDIAGELL